MIKTWLHNLFIAADQLANALIGGDPDETISSRTGKAARGDFGPALRLAALPLEFVINCIFWPWQGWGHCRAKIEADEGKDDLIGRRQG